jgi:uncharacterized membrane protein YjjB (DUF3815 family)
MSATATGVLILGSSARPGSPEIIGLTAFTVGFGISVQATWQEVGVSAVTGLLVGLLVVAGIGRRRLSLASPFLALLGVSVLVLELFEHGRFDGGPIQLIVPALFFFIPGDAISAAALELADNRITAGASRLVYSLVTLLVLAFGALVATVVAGVPPSALFDVTVAGNLGPVAGCGGWVLVAAGRPADMRTTNPARSGSRVVGRALPCRQASKRS